ncbi:MAG: hypothetical protein ACTSSE_14010 [Candidatus Thorarchaeota archaeon]
MNITSIEIGSREYGGAYLGSESMHFAPICIKKGMIIGLEPTTNNLTGFSGKTRFAFTVALPTEPRRLILGVVCESNINVAVCSIINHTMWECTSDMKELDLNKIVLDFIHSETGWGNPLRPGCEFADLYLDEIEKLPGDRIRVVFRYRFDEDGFS